jgi:hypothetical protein
MERQSGSNVRDDLTVLLLEWQNGDQGALGRLTPLVYEELRRLAAGISDGGLKRTASFGYAAHVTGRNGAQRVTS